MESWTNYLIKMGILRVNNIQDRSGNHNSSSFEVFEGRCKAYCSVDMRHGTDGTDNSQIQTGETLAMRESYNISTVVDIGTGRYEISFINSMSDTNYVFLANTSQDLTSYSDGLNANDDFAVPLVRNRNNIRLGSADLDDGDNQADPDGFSIMIFDEGDV